ncbi:MAG: hypothetical protein AAF429_04825 [Pseudomonadota bacterium]
MIRMLVALLVLSSPSFATDAVVYRLGGFIEGCRAALTASDISQFEDLEVTSEMETDTVSIFGWSDGVTGATVSILFKGKSRKKGICDVAYVSDPDGIDETAEMDRLRVTLAEAAMTGPHVIEDSMSGPVILHCHNGRGLALFLDPKAVGKGFSAQISTIEKARMDIECEGET